jgi:glyoxylase-like metal-dependent hydrolase (beta-lactamase superfamily II)
MSNYLQIHRATPDVSVLHDRADIPGLGSLPINAFVVHAAQPVVVDTGLSTNDKDFLTELSDVIDPADVRWIWLTHPDRDHTGGLMALLEAAPQAKLVSTFLGVGILGCQYDVPMDRVHLLNPGQDLDVGDRRLSSFRPALFDSPATTGFLDRNTGALFSSDCFGAPLSSPELAGSETLSSVPADELRAAQLMWASADSPWVHGVDRATWPAHVGAMRAMEPSAIFSTHLPPSIGVPDAMWDTLVEAPDGPRFTGPDQAALEEMLAGFALA